MKKELEKQIKEFLKQIGNKNTKLRFGKFEEVNIGKTDQPIYYTLSLYGGLNGRGQFLFYMEDVSELVKKLMTRFNSVWLIEWKNDCLDDVFIIDLGMTF